jgi:hypothetical protein
MGADRDFNNESAHFRPQENYCLSWKATTPLQRQEPPDELALLVEVISIICRCNFVHGDILPSM